MLDTPISTEQWLRQELDFINTTMSHTLNGQLKAAFVSCNEETQELTLEFPLEGWQVNGLGTLHGGMAYTMMDRSPAYGPAPVHGHRLLVLCWVLILP